MNKLIIIFVLIFNVILGNTQKQKSANYYFQEGNNCMNAMPGMLTSERINQCVQYFSKAININDKFWQAYRNRGRAYYFLHQYQKALLDFNKTLQLADEKINPDLLLWRGRCLYELKLYDKAIRDFDRSIQLSGNTGYIYFCRAKAHWKLGNFRQACLDYHKAVKGSPEYSKEIDFIKCN